MYCWSARDYSHYVSEPRTHTIGKVIELVVPYDRPIVVQAKIWLS